MTLNFFTWEVKDHRNHFWGHFHDILCISHFYHPALSRKTVFTVSYTSNASRCSWNKPFNFSGHCTIGPYPENSNRLEGIECIRGKREAADWRSDLFYYSIAYYFDFSLGRCLFTLALVVVVAVFKTEKIRAAKRETARSRFAARRWCWWRAWPTDRFFFSFEGRD